MARGQQTHCAASYLLDPLIKYYMRLEFCDQKANAAFSDEIPALIQSSASRSMARSMACSLAADLLKVLLFLSFHTHQAVSSNAESNAGHAS